MHLWKDVIGKLILIGFWLLSLVFAEAANAQQSSGSAGIFLRMGVGARPLALGSAYVGLAEGPAATYWNPSGLALLSNFQFEFMNTNLPFDRTFNFFSSVIPVRRIFTLGVSWIGLRVNNIEGRTSNTDEPDFTFNSMQNVVFLSLGKSLAPFLSIGGNVKFIKSDIENQSATGLGFDAGVLIHPIEQIRLGLMVQDLGTDYRWSGGFTEGVPPTYRAGAAFKIYDSVLLVGDVSKTGSLSPTLHVGGEVRPAYFLPIRVGYSDKQIAGGAGFLLPLSQHSLELNYSYANDRIFNDAVHRVSVVFAFGSKSTGRVQGAPVRPVPTKKWETPKATATKKKDSDKRLLTQVVIEADQLNVRSGPGTDYKKVAQVRRGKRFDAVDEKDGWFKIRLRNGKLGWVYESYFRIVN